MTDVQLSLQALGEETPCPSPESDGRHCEHWYDGDGCCWCKDRALTDEELISIGSEPRG